MGGGLAVAPGWRFEPTLFVSRNGLPEGREWRLLLAGQYDAGRGWELGAGVADGHAHDAAQDRAVREYFVRASYAVTPALRLQLLTCRETVSGGDSTSVLALGAALAWR